MPAPKSVRSGGVRDVWEGPTSVAALATTLEPSVKAMREAERMARLVTGPSSLSWLTDFSKRYAGMTDLTAFAGAVKSTESFQRALMGRDAFQGLLATNRAFAGLTTHSFVAQLPRQPLPLSSRTFYGALPEPGALASIRQLATLGAGVQMPAILSQVSALQRDWSLYEAVAVVAGEWEESALWFVLSDLPLRRLLLLKGLDRAQVEEAVLDALEAVVTDGRLVAALREVLAEAPLLSDLQRECLLDGLEHAQRGEHLRAVVPLTCGLDGALTSAARDRSLIDAERRLLSDPRKKAHGPNTVVRELGLDSEFERHLHRHVFAPKGHSFRHVDADGGERRQALFAIVALCGWLDAFVGLSAHATLVELMGDELPGAIERVRGPVLDVAG